MSLWLERLNELDRYYTLLRESEQHRLAYQGQARCLHARKFLYRANFSSQKIAKLVFLVTLLAILLRSS